MKETEQIKHELTKHLEGGEAFVPVEDLLKLIPFETLGTRPGNLPYSFYEVFYHIWYTQKDILEYCLNENYKLPDWPADYWPSESFPENENSWMILQKEYFEDREKFSRHIGDPETDLTSPLSNGKDHSLLREILLVIEHTAYHTGQLLIILRKLGLYDNNRVGK